MLESVSGEVYRCLRCGWCRESQWDRGETAGSVCPVREILGFESSYARGRVMLARAMLEGRLDVDSALADRIFTCLDCRACEKACPLELRLSDIFWRTKREAFLGGHIPPALVKTREAILGSGNPFGLGDDFKGVPGGSGADLVYFAGCYHLLRTPAVGRACESLLQAAGCRFTTLSPGTCCGLPLWGMGDEEGARRQAERVLEALRPFEPKEVVTSCPACYAFIKGEYPRLLGALPFAVSHMTEKLAEFFCSNVFTVPGEGKVTYHDPCHLGRHSGVYEAPRIWLRSLYGERLVEMNRYAESARCCGGGSTVLVAYPAVGRAVASHRVKDAVEVGADTVVTCCPACMMTLKSGAGSRIKVKDLFELAASALLGEGRVQLP